ncbi:unnamed protein product [Paramecium primaurelia]|uniref:START domain-containing protein n=1 Tax=Paramecium primaurelia TaxID=5886 RepID=A0A8S1N124_PARPR|nr:unnamed protein product [Paramecium primaurelia]
MGNNFCLGKRSFKKKNEIEHQMFIQEIDYQLDKLKEIPYKQYKHPEYENKTIIDLLQVIDIKSTRQSIIEPEQEKEVIKVDEIKPDEFNQYQELGKEIITQIQQKIQEFPLNEKNWSLLLDDTKSPHFLKLFIRQVQLPDGNKINVTFSQFIVPCKSERFIQFMGDFKDQIKLDNRIDQFKCIKKHPEKLEQLIYLSYKSVSIVSARDFVYFKKTEQINKDNDIWCDASRSIIDNSICPIQNKIVRGNIELSGYIIQPLKNVMKQEYFSQRFSTIVFKVDSYSLVQLWSECDFKLSVPLYLAKGQVKQEMANYINLVYRSLL